MEVGHQLLGGRYQLLHELGTGGMAVVWRARDEVLGRSVAVKVLAGRFADDPQSRSRIRDEARAAATLSPHPNIAQVYDFGESTDGGSPRPYVVMELVNGPTLQQRVALGPMPPRTVFRICGEVASALAAAHADGLVHRDIKPANVMVTPSGAKVVDFGIAAVAGPRDPEDILLGTPAYLAPERLTGGPVEPATDVYALGVLLYRLLAHESPWTVDSTTQMLSAHIYLEPTPLPDLPGVPPAVTDLVEHCLRKDPGERPCAAEASAILADAAEASKALVRPQQPAVALPVPEPVGVSQPGDVSQSFGQSQAIGPGHGAGAGPDAGGRPDSADPPSKPLTRRAQALQRLAEAHAAMAATPMAATPMAASAERAAGPGPAAANGESNRSRPGRAGDRPAAPGPVLRAAAGAGTLSKTQVPPPRGAGMERPPRNPGGVDLAEAEEPKPPAGVPERGRRKRRAVLAGGGFAAAVVAALLVWLFTPMHADGGQDRAEVAPPVAADQPTAAANAPTATGGTSGVVPTHGVPGPGQPQLPENRPGGAASAGGPGPVATHSVAPPVTGPASTAPATTTPPADRTKTLSSAGGTVDARCEGGKATLLSWVPKDSYVVQKVNAGPAVTTAIVFKKKASRIRMTITCVAGVPTTVNLPI